MAESVVVPEKKVKKVAGPKKVKAAPTHPPTQEMVNAAITTLKERGGSSLLAIKKYVGATYKVDIQKISPFIKKYLKSAVESGKLVQTKGKGANGSFKLSKPNEKEKKQKPKPKAAKSTGAKKAVKPKVDGGQKTIKKAGEKTAKKVSGGSKATAKKAVVKKEKPKGRSGIKAKPTKTKSAITKVKVKTPKVKTTSGAKTPKVAVAAKKAKK